MSEHILAAVRILADCYERLELDYQISRAQRLQGQFTLARAIRHIAHPERDIYPKVRTATKRKPVISKSLPHAKSLWNGAMKEDLDD